MRKFLSLLMAVMFVGSMYATEELKATLKFDSTVDWGIPTSGTNTSSASFTDGTYTIQLAAADNYKQNNGYLILGKSGSTLTLPAFTWKTTKIAVTGTSGASEKVKQNIFVGDNAVSTETTGAKNVTNEYAIAQAYQAAGNVYVFKVTSSHNTQITKIEIYGEAAGGEDPQPAGPAYYLVGTMNNWQAAEAYKFAAAETEGEYLLHTTLAVGDEIKVIKVEGETTTWYPAEGDNYVVDAAHAGEKDIYFRPAGNEAWSEFGGYIWMGENQPAPVVAAYYLVGTLNEWTAAEAYKFAAAETEGEYLLHTTLAVGDEIKVIKVEGETTTWYPAEGDNYVVDAAHAGEKDIYFRPAGNEAWSAFGGYIWMGENPVSDFTQPFTLKFNGTGESGKDNSAAFAADVAAIFDAASAPYVASVETATKIYAGRPIADDNSSVKFGTSSAAGTLAFTLAQAIEVDSIIVNATQYGNNAAKVTVNGTEFDLTAGNKVPQDCKITPEGAVSAITIAQSGTERIYLRNVRVYPKQGGVDPQPVVKYYIIGGEDIVGEGKYDWNPANALPSYSREYVLNLAAGFHKFKVITTDSQWKGIEALTDTAAGIYTDADGNICFDMVEAGAVTVVYDENEFTVSGNFAIVQHPNFYVVGGEDIVGEGHATWNKEGGLVSYGDTLEMNLAAGDHSLKVVTPTDAWLGFNALTDTAAGLYPLDDQYGGWNIGFTLEEAGVVQVIYTGEIFKLAGNFYVAPAPEAHYYLKNNWNGDEKWSWKEMTKDGKWYVLDSVVFGGSGVDLNTAESEDGKRWYGLEDISGDEIQALDTVRFTYDEASNGLSVELIGRPQPIAPTLENGFYLVGNFNAWTPAAEYHLVGNPENPVEFMVNATLAENDSLKVVNVVNDAITAWYPTGDNYVVDAAHAGEKTVYFMPDYQEAWGGFIYIPANVEPQPDPENLWKVTEETAVAAGTVYVNNDLLKMESVYAGTLVPNERSFGLFTSTHAIQVRVNAWPTASNVTGTEQSGSTPLVVTAKENVTITLFYNRQAKDGAFVDNDSKDVAVYDQADITKLNGVLTVVEENEDHTYAKVSKKVELVKGHVYTVCAKGTTIQMHGMLFEGASAPADPTVSVFGSMTRPAWEVEIPFELSEDKTYATLYNDDIKPGEYTFKLQVNGEWRSNGYRYHRDFPGAAGITGNADADMTFVADQEGEYTFTWFFANDSLAITYPEYIEPAKEYYAKYAPAWEWTKLTEAEGLWLTDTIVYGGIGVNINDAAADENNMFYSNTVEEQGVRPIAGPEIDKGDTVYFSFSPADSVLTAVMVGKYVAPVVVPTVSVFGTMTNPAWEVEVPFVLSADETYASLTVNNIDAGEYNFKFYVNGEWRSNGYRYHRGFPGAAGITGNADANMTFEADVEGQYTFYWYFANDSAAIVYPELPFQCNWEELPFLGDGSPEQTHGNQFKLCKEGQYPGVVNVQKPGFADESGIYVTFPNGAFGEISLPQGKYAIQGAGMILYCSAFTEEYTEVTVVCDNNPIVFTVYNANTTPAPVDPTVAVAGEMTVPAWEGEIPFTLAEDKQSATLHIENIPAGEYAFKLKINGEWRSNGYRYHRGFQGAAGITENNEANMVFVADEPGAYTFTWFFANDSIDFIYPAKPEPVLANGYYLVGTHNEWTPSAEEMFAANESALGEYILHTTLAVGQGIKVARVENDDIVAWYPEGQGNEYVVTEQHAGSRDIYFRPEYIADWAEFGGHIYIAIATGIDNLDANAPAMKVLREGQILIIKGNKTFNAQGQLVK